MKFKIKKEFEEINPPLEDNELAVLREGIKKDGVEDPIKVLPDGTIIDGHNRYKIASEFNKKVSYTIKNIKDENDIKIYIVNTNLSRRNLSLPTKIEQVLKLKEFEIAKALKRQQTTLPKKGEKGFQCGGNISTTIGKGKTRDILGKRIGTSGKTLEKAEKVIKKSPDLWEDVKEKKITISTAYKKLNRDEKPIFTPKVAEGKFNVIYADPPWKYDFSQTESGKVENTYRTMELKDIKEIDIKKNIAENSVLYLWATAPKLIEALEVMEAWGFTYKTNMVWDKVVTGMGYWSRGQHEHLLIGTKGKFSPPEAKQRISSVFVEKRTKHSKKPDEIRKLIEEWYPNIPRMELFARQKYDDWYCWGNEV